MSRETPLKAEKDFTDTLNEQFPQIEKLATTDYHSALDKLLLLEKQTRQASDLASSKRILKYLVDLLTSKNDWNLLNEQVLLLSKKHGQLKNSVQAMVQQVIEHLHELDKNLNLKIETIENIRSITENKIYLEIERARVSKILSDILLKEKNDLDKATKILCELQVETYGSMELEEKIEFILNQIELCNMKGDYQFAKILSRKILVKSLDKFDKLKLKYYKLIIEIALSENDYINIVRYYLSIYDLKQIEAEKLEILSNVVFFVILSPYSNLQSDLINKILLNSELYKIPLQNQLIKSFATAELINWDNISNSLSSELFHYEIFDQSKEKGKLHYKDLQKRVIEHNLRIISKYYSSITLERLCELLQLKQLEVEDYITNLVNDGIIYAKINRPFKVVNFIKSKSNNELLNDWSSNIDTLLQHLESIEHLINKEEMMKSLA
ncbi:hypothetical protein PACTADRAFT_51576 [Pachysolen tannophilus NRRL Y-2460]|uniref:PCI domain-containing protein n=1 Tax=Pachysolen tannophilus NRRL Y-2460 TaxID=669874 RepID=A0A1E4TQ03_PACTA|nr:hypothetical protein PACTADRAFT_51576 [Pachysolen tannophilus NRRL Y-2460]